MNKKYILKKSDTSPAEKKFKIDYAKELNSSQLKAVKATDGPVLVIAGAGSGKTRTLVYRVAHLVESGIKPESILLLTFTRKSAEEMLRRASLILDYRCGKVSGGTFHSFANQVLRKHAGLLGLANNFVILDRTDAEDVINLIRTQGGFANKETRFPKKNTIADIISKAVNKSWSIRKVIEDEYPHFIENSQDIGRIALVYQKFKQARSILDYDDLLSYLYRLLSENADVRKKLSDKYRYIMIDEFQDTNKLQFRIGLLLASEHGNIMAVGDDAQSIYSFRGAHFKNILDFPKIFPDTRVIKLEENFRSRQPILDLTNRIIQNAQEKYAKHLFANREGGEMPVLLEVRNENQQSRFIVQKVLELREQGIPLDEMAVLFRAGWHSNDLEIELARANIPFVKYGGFKFIETAHIKDVLAYLRVAYNSKDAISWLRILQLIEGVGPKSANDIIVGIVDGEGGIKYLTDKAFEAKKFYKPLKQLFNLLHKLQSKSLAPAEQIEMLYDHYRPILEKKYDDYHKRLGDLDSLSRVAERYKGLEKFLTDLSLEPIDLTQTDTAEEGLDKEKLILSTIHSAKGLEWNTVFIIFANDGFLPSSRSMGSTKDIEEERRLLYVAATRAKDNLYIIKPDMEFSGRNYFDESFMGFSQLSRFLTEGEVMDFLDRWSLDEEDEHDPDEIIYIDSDE